MLYEYCDRGMLIDGGTKQTHGDTEEVARAYSELFTGQPDVAKKDRSKRWGTSPTIMRNVNVKIDNEEILIKGNLLADKELSNPILGFVIKNAQGVPILGANNKSA